MQESYHRQRIVISITLYLVQYYCIIVATTLLFMFYAIICLPLYPLVFVLS